MIVVTVHAAQTLTGREAAHPTTIVVERPVEPDAAGQTFRLDGVIRARALLECLPGGTVDSMLVELLDHRRSRLTVSLEAYR